MNRMLLAAALAGVFGAAVCGQERPRVFVSDSHSWEMGGGFGIGDRGSGGGSFPAVTVTLERNRADFVVLLDHEGGKGILRDNKVAVFNRSGDLLETSSTRVLGNAVKDACRAIVGAPRS
jgi:hypothetical protein